MMLLHWSRSLLVVLIVSLLIGCGDDADTRDSTSTADAGDVGQQDGESEGEQADADGGQPDAEADANAQPSVLQQQVEAACSAIISLEEDVSAPGAKDRESLTEAWEPVEGREHKYVARNFFDSSDLSSMHIDGWLRLKTSPGDQVALFLAGDYPESDGSPGPEPRRKTTVEAYGSGDSELVVTKHRQGISDLGWPESCGSLHAVHVFTADADSVDVYFLVRNLGEGGVVEGGVQRGYVDIRPQ